MSYPIPMLPATAHDEVLLVCTCYREGAPQWDEVLRFLGSRGGGETILLDDGGVRLRPTQNPGWDFLHAGNFPALAPQGAATPPVVVLVDIPAVYGKDAVMLVDLREIPGRGVRVPADGLGRVLAGLLDGRLRFDDLVRGMDRYGRYLGDGGAPATATPTTVTTVTRTSFPQLPAVESTVLVRTDFADEQGWRALVEALGTDDEDDAWPDAGSYDAPMLRAVVVDDRAFEQLQPGQVPALVPPDEHTTMVALADAATMADPAFPLLVVDLYDTPGQVTRIPLAEAGPMAVNLEISNMDFADFV